MCSRADQVQVVAVDFVEQPRRFVLEPLAEIAPEWVHPMFGVTVRELLNRVVA